MLTIIVLILVGLIALFHYGQGLFSATLSAFIAILSAIIAVGTHEWAASHFASGKFADSADGVLLCAIFAICYLVMRVAVDLLIPGNVRFPFLMDRIGSACMGVVAGLFAVGIVVIAAQEMPISASVLGYARYEVTPSRAVTVIRADSMREDAHVFNQMRASSFTDARVIHLALPCDDLVMATASLASDGSLSSSRALSAIHPNWLQELFGQRVDVVSGARIVAVNEPGDQQVTLKQLYTLRKVPQELGEVQELRKADEPALSPVLLPGPDEAIIVARVLFNPSSADPDGVTRLTPSAVRLVADGKDFYPLGTLENGKILFREYVDQPLFLNTKDAAKSADFVFLVNPSDKILTSGGPKSTPTLAPGSFLEVKRMARIALDDSSVKFASAVESVPRDAAGGVMRKRTVLPVSMYVEIDPAWLRICPLTAFNQTHIPLTLSRIGNVAAGPVRISGPKGPPILTVLMKQGKVDSFAITDEQPLGDVASDVPGIESQLYVSHDRAVFVLEAVVNPESKTPWGFSDVIGQFDIQDDHAQKHPIDGVLVEDSKDSSLMLVGNFSVGQHHLVMAKGQGEPQKIWMIFELPRQTHLRDLRFQGKSVLDMTHITVP